MRPSTLVFCLFVAASSACDAGHKNTPDGPSSSDAGPASHGDGDGDAHGDGDAPPNHDAAVQDDGGDRSDAGGSTAGDAMVPTPPAHAQRVVGYLRTGSDFAAWAARLPASGLTHINLAFANPRNGNGPGVGGNEAQLDALVTAAHAANVSVLISIGGGGSGSNTVGDLLAPATVDDLVVGLRKYVADHQLDGVDVDIEGDPALTDNYGPFVQKLRTAMHDDHKLITAALATWFLDGIATDTLSAFDFINVMSYDHCGPWTDACEQATYDAALMDLAAFAARDQAKERLVLGVPFYAYCWGTCDQEALTFGDIVAQYPSFIDKDWIDQDGRQLSYNGTATMAKKKKLATDYGGVMIWELDQDASGEHSLLKLLTDE
jgi:chitinase